MSDSSKSPDSSKSLYKNNVTSNILAIGAFLLGLAIVAFYIFYFINIFECQKNEELMVKNVNPSKELCKDINSDTLLTKSDSQLINSGNNKIPEVPFTIILLMLMLIVGALISKFNFMKEEMKKKEEETKKKEEELNNEIVKKSIEIGEKEKELITKNNEIEERDSKIGELVLKVDSIKELKFILKYDKKLPELTEELLEKGKLYVFQNEHDSRRFEIISNNIEAKLNGNEIKVSFKNLNLFKELSEKVVQGSNEK